jgi:hypothetical protein
VVRRKVSACILDDRGSDPIVVDQSPRGGGQPDGIVVRHLDASAFHRQPGRRPLHRHDGELPGERIEHLDR